MTRSPRRGDVVALPHRSGVPVVEAEVVETLPGARVKVRVLRSGRFLNWPVVGLVLVSASHAA